MLVYGCCLVFLGVEPISNTLKKIRTIPRMFWELIFVRCVCIDLDLLGPLGLKNIYILLLHFFRMIWEAKFLSSVCINHALKHIQQGYMSCFLNIYESYLVF